MSVSEKRRKQIDKWDSEHIKRITIAINNGLYQRLKSHTDKTGEKKNRFITNAIDNELKRNGE